MSIWFMIYLITIYTGTYKKKKLGERFNPPPI